MTKILTVLLITLFSLQVNANQFLDNYELVGEKSVTEKTDKMDDNNVKEYENVEFRTNQQHATTKEESIVDQEIKEEEVAPVEPVDIDTEETTESSDTEIAVITPDMHLDEKTGPVLNNIPEIKPEIELTPISPVEPIKQTINVVDDVDILLNETTEKISNETIKENIDTKSNEDYNNMLLDKIRDLEKRVTELERLQNQVKEEI